MLSQFSEDGKYYVEISPEGKLKVWDTSNNRFQTEFAPNLNSPCTCLHFVPYRPSRGSSQQIIKGSPGSKKRRISPTEQQASHIALGSKTGILIVFSLNKAEVEYTINSETSQPISCLSFDDRCNLYSGAENQIIVWNLDSRNVSGKWNATENAREKITAVLCLPNENNRLLIACKCIKLWDTVSREILKTFTGHSSDVVLLQHVATTDKAYFISGSKGDRLLSCYSLSDADDHKKNDAHVTFLMDDVILGLSVNVNANDGSTSLAATVKSGCVHVYKHTLDKQCNRPMRAEKTFRVVSEKEGSEEKDHNTNIIPIPICGAFYRKDSGALCIAYGNDILKIFEDVSTSSRDTCLIRKDPRNRRTATSKDHQISKIRTPLIDNEVDYLTLQSIPMTAAKRKFAKAADSSLGTRIKNLSLNKDHQSDLDGSLRAKNLAHAQLLIQGLQSKDKQILRMVLTNQRDDLISETVRRLPMSAVVPLIAELTPMFQAKSVQCQVAVKWLRQILKHHAAILISQPDLMDVLQPISAAITCRSANAERLRRLKGRTDLLRNQINMADGNGRMIVDSETEEDDDPPMLAYVDKDGEDSDSGTSYSEDSKEERPKHQSDSVQEDSK